MVKLFFVGTCVTFLSLLTPIAVQAGADQLITPPVSRTSTPTAAGITPLELQQFVQTLKQLQAIEAETQGKMAKTIQGEGLSVERFVEIDKFLATGSPPKTGEITSGDRQKYTAAVTKIQKIWQESQPKRERAINSQGLNAARFSEINNQVQKDPDLKQKIKQMLGS